MGFFSKSKKTVSPQGALVLSMMAMIEIDGDADDAEVDILVRIVANSDGDESFEELEKLYDDTEDLSNLLDLITNSLDEKQRMTVIANLLDTAMADGVLEEDEKVLLKAFINAFKLDSDDVDTIIKVIAIKNRAL
jgi:uncharacterized tellurite resistance protein B-like protein